MTSHSTRQYAGRNVVVHLPPGYDASRREPYPLLLLHDGQNLFDWREGALGGSWHADETIDRLVAAGRIPPLVLAGIDHAEEHRISEFTPTPGQDGRPAAYPRGGRADEYGRLVMRDMLPRLAKDFHVRADFDGLGLGGASLGGLITLWMAASYPDRFGRLLAMSPSVWWDRRVILRELRRRPLNGSARIWMDAGRKEGRVVARDARSLRDLLEPRHADLRYVEDPDGDHSEASWGRRFADAIEWLYRAPEDARERTNGLNRRRISD